MARLSGRWLCRDCHSSYHVLFSPPTTPGVCDRCGGPLYQRADDTLETARRRLEVYDRDTKPVLEHYPEDKIARIDATMSQIKVLRAIMDIITPIKSDIDHAHETAERSGLMDKPQPVGAT